MDYKDIAKRKQPRQRSVEILLDEDLMTRRDDLFTQIRRHERSESLDGGDMASPLPGLRQQLLDLSDEMVEATVTFTFKSFPRKAWNDAVTRFEDGDGNLGEDFEVFIIAKSSVDPKLTAKQVRSMFTSKDWSAAEIDQLFDAAYRVNREVRNTLFTQAGISEILNSGLSSTTAQSEE
ncbi:hypothetical protein LCGC14_0859450 [marine sediment metagenome]|uniref:Uncharacterized protein n=1 Tax=marine sediment metagenome TaxID=412755 RepID=A0A0F9RSG3_9ZZZZ